jgi:membrane protein DedA with SNARE-associated domain
MLYGLTHNFSHFINTFGYLGIFFIIAAESLGVLLPGETTLITASAYAGTTHKLNIIIIILAAVLGAIIGDNLGYLIGRYGGYALVKRYGKYIHLDNNVLKVGRYMFMVHGGKIVFFGRFISFLRSWAAFFAGLDKMPWKRFLIYNATGGLLWACFYGTLGYLFGHEFRTLSRPFRVVFFVTGFLILISSTIYIQYNLKEIEKKAKKAFPGPLT